MLKGGRAEPQKAQTVDRTKTHDDQEPRTCRSATNQRHAHAEAPPACTRLAGTPLLGKVRALKASAKNAGLIPLTPPHGHSNLKVEPQTKTTATWRASAKQVTPRSAASQHSENSLTKSGILADIVVSWWSCFASSTGLPVLLFSFVSSVSGPYTCFHRFVFEIDKPASAPMLSSPLLPLSEQRLSERLQPEGNNTSN